MPRSLKSLGAITLFVENLPRAAAFYRDMLELRAVNEDDNAVAFDFGNTIINLLKITEAHDLIAPGVVGGREAGSRFQLTIWTDDADAVCEDLAKRGVVLLNGPMNREWGMRTACFTDPDGFIWEIAQEPLQKSSS